MDIIRARLKVAEALAKELRNEKTHGNHPAESVRHDARRLLQPVRAQVDGLPEPAWLRHRNQGETDL